MNPNSWEPMLFTRPAPTAESQPILLGHGVMLRAPVPPDYEAWARLREASREHLTPFEPMWAEEELSRNSFHYRLKRYQYEARNDLGYSFLVLSRDGRQLVGGISLAIVRRGASQSASVGYWIGAPHTGRGHASASLACLCRYAFNDLSLHRLEAASMPRNAASLRVLEKNGFEREGLARRFLKINGAWEDHVLLARIGGDGTG
jgi:[ribosomal protein S5]-alanine N-acetyltransferase